MSVIFWNQSIKSKVGKNKTTNQMITVSMVKYVYLHGEKKINNLNEFDDKKL